MTKPALSEEMYLDQRMIQLKDLATIAQVNEIDSKVNLLKDYSTEEQVVGTWIDGRPIYRKVFDIGTPSSQMTYYSHGIENLSMPIKIYGMYRRTNLDMWNFIPGNYANWEAYAYDFNATTFSLRFSNNQWNSGVNDCKVIVEYVKTT